MPAYSGRKMCPFYKPRDDAPTPHLMVGNMPDAASCLDALRATLSRFGSLVQLEPAGEGASHTWASFESAEAASAARTSLSGTCLPELGGRPLVVQHAALRPPRQSQEERLATLVPATEDAAALGMAGLLLLSEFVGEAEEAALLAALDAAPWQVLARRRVQHYGRGFDYCARRLDAEAAHPPIPQTLRPLVARLEALPGVGPGAVDQLTANEYAAGVGIAPHAGAPRGGRRVPQMLGQGASSAGVQGCRAPHPDAGVFFLWHFKKKRRRWRPRPVTRSPPPRPPRADCHSAFGPFVALVSLLSPCALVFRREGAAPRALLLPRRSALLLAGEARYAWEVGRCPAGGGALPPQPLPALPASVPAVATAGAACKPF